MSGSHPPHVPILFEKELMMLAEKAKTYAALHYEAQCLYLDAFVTQARKIFAEAKPPPTLVFGGAAAALAQPPLPAPSARVAPPEKDKEEEEGEEEVVEEVEEEEVVEHSPTVTPHKRGKRRLSFPSPPSSPDSSAQEEESGDSDDDDDDEEEFEEDSFVDNTKNPPVYEKKKKQKGKLPAPRVSGRLRKKAALWSPADHDGERVGQDIDLMANEEDEEGDLGAEQDYERFRVMAQTHSVPFAMAGSDFYKRRYGNTLEGIRNNLGREGNNAGPQHLFDQIRLQHSRPERDGVAKPYVYFKSSSGSGRTEKVCSLCNMKKRCLHELYVDNAPHPIAACCSHLADELVGFFSALYERKSLSKVDKAFAAVMAAHAKKGEKPQGRR